MFPHTTDGVDWLCGYKPYLKTVGFQETKIQRDCICRLIMLEIVFAALSRSAGAMTQQAD
jgi:hypothetical protein